MAKFWLSSGEGSRLNKNRYGVLAATYRIHAKKMLSPGFIRGSFLGLLLLILSQLHAYGQSCSCPPIATCGCNVGLTELTVRFTGLLGLTVSVEDDGGIIYSGLLLVNGTTFNVQSSAGAGLPFVGNTVRIRTTLLILADINTSCTDQVKIGTTFGNFIVTAGKSVGGLPICCETMETTKPVISGCPANRTVSADPLLCGANVPWTAPTVADNCAVASFTSDHNSGDFFPVGPPTTVTYTATDNYGNISTCQFNVTVTDNTPPQFTSCPSNITIPVDAGSCDALVTWGAVTATDNCGTVNLSSTNNSGETFDLGPHTVQYTAEDASNNTSICSFTITVVDETPPAFTFCPPDLIVPASAVSCNAVVSWSPPVVTDFCDPSPTITSSHPSGSTFALGARVVELYAEDASGNRDTCRFTLTVIDDTPPTFAGCPSDITVPVDAGSCLATVNWTEPTVADACDASPILTSSHPLGATFGLGTTTVEYYVRDASNNRDTCSFTVTVLDNIKPTFAGCPADMTVPINSGPCDAIVNWLPPTVTDNCDASPLLSSNHPSGTTFGLGPHTIEYYTADASGNKDTCSFTVTVIDDIKPTFTGCPADMTVSVDPGSCEAAVNWIAPTAADNCDLSVDITSTHTPVATLAAGPHTISYFAVDDSGNRDTCSFTITVIDDIKPAFAGCPANITVSANSSCEATPIWAEPTASDNCDPSPVVTSTHAPGASFGLGTETVEYYVVDASGNRDTCSFTVTVIDDTKPMFAGCPANMVVPVSSTSCLATINWVEPTVSDNCDASPNLTSTHSPGATLGLGLYTIEYYAEDAAGNRDTCSFTVNVIDDTKPTFTGCPSDMTLPVDPGSCEAAVNWLPPTVSDNCDASPAMTSSHLPGATLALGPHTIEYYVTDASGNKDTCSFIITMIDATTPVISGCPADITISADATSCGTIVTWIEPTASDNCTTSPTVTSDFNSGDFFPVGTTTVHYEATDAAGNINNTCSFVVTVTDNTAPVFAGCPANIAVFADASACGTNVNWIEPTATDNCTATPTVTSDFLPGDFFPVGITTVHYEAKDAAGNINNTCTFVVTVTDNTAPVIANCPGDISVAAVGTPCGAVVTWVPPLESDNCTVTMTSNHDPGETFPLGITAVIYTATDGAGNITTCSFDVEVRDDVSPVYSNCPTNITLAADASLCGANVMWNAPTVTDNCSATLTTTNSHDPGDFFAAGSVTTVVYTARDGAGNNSSCSFTVTVQDTTVPVFTGCPLDISVASDDICGAVVNWIEPTASDNCSIASLTQSHHPGERFEMGVTPVEYKATDPSGNVTSCTFNITVRNEDVPVISDCPEDILVKVGESGEGAATWEPPTAANRCGELSLSNSREPGTIFQVGTTPVQYTATNDAGISVTCTFNVVVAYQDFIIDVVKVVTPDGDGVNDEWIVSNIEVFNRNKVTIVDRWGSVVYQAAGYNNSSIAWKGTNASGSDVPTGTYFYHIEVNFRDKHLERNGFIELIR